MRKIKKINGYLVVKFSDRERREWESLGTYGVIDTELYSGHIDIDRGAMEYDDADTLEVAIEQAQGLESVLDVEEPAVTVTVVRETDDATEEEEFDAQLLINGWESELKMQVKSHCHPEVGPHTAAHQLYGFKVALNHLGILDSEECYVRPDTFGGDDTMGPLLREQFEHIPPALKNDFYARELYALGLALEKDCPQNDCRIYLNVFNMARELDDTLDRLEGHAADVLRRELLKNHRELWEMYLHNYAIQNYKEARQL